MRLDFDQRPFLLVAQLTLVEAGVQPVGLAMHTCHWSHCARIAIAAVVVVVENYIQTCCTIRRSYRFASLLELRQPDIAAQVLGTAAEVALDTAAAVLLDTSEGQVLGTVVAGRPD